MKQYKVGIIGGTGMVGQRFITLMENHPWFQLTAIAASGRSAGKPYAQAVEGRWALDVPMPEEAKDLVVLDAEKDAEQLASMVDFCFCAVDMKKEEIRALEEKYAKLECPIVSNNSAHRWTDDVPMVVPEINPDHLEVIEAQCRRLGTRRGFIAVKSNCSLQSYVPALHPLKKYGLDKILVCTYQAISGAGKTFQRWPEMVDNCIPYIGGEEEKSEQEPLKLWGRVEDGRIVKAEGPSITAQCFRVACQDGHMAAVFMKFADGKAPSMEQIKADWAAFRGVPQELADTYGLETISDLIPIADQLTFGAEQEFFTAEGSMKYDPFVAFYGLNFKNHVSVDMGLKYSAIENGTFNVAVVYSTDGLNIKTGLKVLEDDLGFFPDYYGMYIVRGDLLEKYPEVEGILEQLTGKISTEQMTQLTYQVDVEGRTVDEVAHEFLVSLGLLDA